MTKDKPIGFVSYASGLILAELLGVDRWRVTVAGQDNPGMARTLTALYRDTYHGPADGYYGQWIVADLARMMDGVAVFDQPAPCPPDCIP